MSGIKSYSSLEFSWYITTIKILLFASGGHPVTNNRDTVNTTEWGLKPEI